MEGGRDERLPSAFLTIASPGYFEALGVRLRQGRLFTDRSLVRIMSFELRVAGLSKTYSNGVRALDKVSLTIPTGLFGLLGPNGAGKSTLMRTIAALQEPDEGTITLAGLDVLTE